MLRAVLHNGFLCILTVTSGLIAEYIIASLSTSNSYTISNFNEFFIIAIFVSLNAIDTQHKEYKMKKKFWINHRDDKNNKLSLTLKTDEIGANFCTETELLIQTCNKIKKTIKDACTVIIFKDVKDSLKLAQIELEQVKQRIGRAEYLNDVKIEQHELLDPEDKEFISQNFIDISYVTAERSHAHTELTVFEFNEKVENFPFSHYGIDKLESVLSQLGKN